MVRNAAQYRVDLSFVENIKRLYPKCRSVREATKKLNNVLEEMLYGTTIRKK